MRELNLASRLIEKTVRQRETLTVNLAKAVTFIGKDMKIALSYKLQFIFQLSQTFFSVAILYFIGKMLTDIGKTSLMKEYNADYFSFAMVGLAINGYLRAGMESTTNNIRQSMDQGILEAVCAAPINYTWLLLCSSLWQFVFETIRLSLYFLLAIALFGMRLENANWAGAILCLILTAPIFLMLGILSCSILIVVKRGDPINWIFSRASSLLAGTMFPISVFPLWLQTVALCLPLTHSLEAMRRCLLTGANINQVSSNIWSLSAFIALLTPLTIFVNNICMRKAKRSGAFTTH